jgi:hypothetical protein
MRFIGYNHFVGHANEHAHTEFINLCQRVIHVALFPAIGAKLPFRQLGKVIAYP